MSAPRDQWWPAASEPNVVARFAYQDDIDVKASLAADEHVYRKIIVCWTKVIGDPDENCLPVKEFNQKELVRRFPDAWKAFNGEAMAVEGTPLTELGLSESEIVNYRINAIYVVEQVAKLSDAQCERVGFGTKKKREAAIALLAKKKSDAEAVVLKAAETITTKKVGRPSKADIAARSAA